MPNVVAVEIEQVGRLTAQHVGELAGHEAKDKQVMVMPRLSRHGAGIDCGRD